MAAEALALHPGNHLLWGSAADDSMIAGDSTVKKVSQLTTTRLVPSYYL